MKLKLFEEYSKSYYQTIDFDDYDKSYHNRVEMSRDRILPARSIEYYKCDQLEGLIQLLKSKKII